MKQIVAPRTGVTDGAGWCHRMARAVFNAPLVYGLDSATKAANATKYRHTTRKMPNVAVPVWFWHYGTYGGVTGEFGHVVVWVPGRGFLTSPWYLAHGQEWYSTLEEVERRFNSKYRFWSEDINGLRVAQPASKPSTPDASKTSGALLVRRKRRRNNMLIFVYLAKGAPNGQHQFAIYEHGKPGTWWEFNGQSSANQLATQLGSAMGLSKNTWNDRKKKHS